MSTPTIIVENLHKYYGGIKALNGVDLSVEEGMVLGILGPNGAGKTTMIRILTTLLRPDKGKVTICGFDVRKQSSEVRARIGLTGQYAAVDEYLTGRENLEMVGRLYRLNKKDIKYRTEELLERFDLRDASNRPVKTYSGGMQRRIDLAMSLVASPPVLFLDEPTTGLDPRSRLTMWSVIKELAATDVTVLLTTQYMEEADHLSDRIAVIDRGQVIAEGTPPELKAKVGSDHIEVVIKEISDFDSATRLPGFKTIYVDAKRRSLRIPTINGPGDINEILRYFEKLKIEVESLSLDRPTLDDVFLSITGRTSEEDNNSN